jgi:hypothetical protein
MKIPEIVINNSTKDYIISRGFFNSYVTNNGRIDLTSKIKWIGIYKAYEIF